jgi:hypothetical protein
LTIGFQVGYTLFAKTGVGQAGTIPVFCAQHDNDIFQQIDKLNIDLNNQEHLFKIAFKTIAFSFRHVQYLMGIDSQVEIFRPLLYLDNQANTPVQSHVTLQISKHTCEQYLRLEITNDVFRESIKILRKKEYEKFSYFHRTLDYNGKIFFSGLVNPLFDLAGKRIGNRKTPINMALNIFTKEKKIYVLIACPPKSRKLYSNLLNQLKNAKEEAFITFLNEVLESTSNKPLLPLNFNLTSKFIHK